MTLASMVLTQPLLHALGWALLDSLWQGLAAAAVLACALWILQGRSPQLRYWLCCSALIVAIALPCMTFAQLAAQSMAAETGPPAAISLHNAFDPGMVSPRAPTPIDRALVLLDRAAPWMPCVWLAGVAFCLGRLGFGLAITGKMRASTGHAIPEAWLRQFELLKAQLALSPAVQLISSARVQTPLAMGWLRPVVMIPIACLTGMPPEQIEAILAHELAHIQRGDYLVSVLQSVAEAVFFYHPAVWWISKQIRIEREYCCDDVAVRLCADRLVYAQALTFLAQYQATAPAFAPGANGGALSMRIRRILGHDEMPAVSRTATISLCALSLAASLCLGAAYAKPLLGDLQAQSATETAVQALPKVYREWLTQDVVWLITPAERTAFLALKSDKDRDGFIAEFWKMRDPGPQDERSAFLQKFNSQRLGGTAADTNAFRTEHYRRIAYANMHFGSTDVPGWKSDRGHVYIVYGPPQSVDAHPAGGMNGDVKLAEAFEVWHYDQTPEAAKRAADFTFLDNCNCGDYTLQAGERP